MEAQSYARMRFMRTALLWLLVLGLADVAHAEDAGCPADEETPAIVGPYETFPANGANGVALNAPLRARYSPGELEALGAIDRLVEATNVDTGERIAGAAQRVGDTLVFFPAGGWPPNARVDTLVRGLGLSQQVLFRTGAFDDVSAPEFSGAPSLQSGESECSRWRIGVTFDSAYDVDGAPADIEYLLYQTRGVGLDSPRLRLRERNYAGGTITMAFALPSENVTESLCVRVLAVDGAGHVTEGEEACFDALASDDFQPLCTASPGASTSRPAWLASLFVLAASLLRRRHRRRQR